MEQLKDRPAYVRFERRAVEDRSKTLTSGAFGFKDEVFVLITPVGSKDEVIKPVKEWLAQCKQQVKEGRMPPEFEQRYVAIYEAWARGDELPVDGTPIKGWPVLSPSQQQVVIAANVRTVEDLAAANGEAIARMGMGGLELKQKAESWLKAAKEVGVVVQENASLRAQLRDRDITILNLQGRLDEAQQKLLSLGQIQGAKEVPVQEVTV